MIAPINLEDDAVDSVPVAALTATVAPATSPAAPEPAPAPTDDEVVEMEICPTPPEVALAICHAVKQYLSRTPTKDAEGRASALPTYPVIVEPSAGSGAFVKACLDVWPGAHVRAVEPREGEHDALRAAGAEQVYSTTLEGFIGNGGDVVLQEADLVIGNPPFSKFTEHVRLLLANMRPGAYLAFLLRLGTLASHDRVSFWQDCPAELLRALVPRPGFKLNGEGKKGTDMQEYGLFVWRKPAGASVGETAFVIGAPIIWRESKRALSAEPKSKKPRRPRKDKGQSRKPQAAALSIAEQKAPVDLE